MIRNSIIGAASTCLTIISFNVNSALVERLGGLAYYDTEANLTWLADANAAAGSTFDEGILGNEGAMTWQNALDWAASLEVAGESGWRLADTLVPDASCDTGPGVAISFNCTGSEKGNLYYNVLGGVADTPLATTHNANFDLFSNIQHTSYWSATEFTFVADFTYDFSFFHGLQAASSTGIGQDSTLFAWAVHSGDVSAVPVPAAAWLFGSGLIGLIGLARRKVRV